MGKKNTKKETMPKEFKLKYKETPSKPSFMSFFIMLIFIPLKTKSTVKPFKMNIWGPNSSDQTGCYIYRET